MGPAHLTPVPEPTSEMATVINALFTMTDKLSAEINKVNVRVDSLILNPSGVVLSSQPHEDYRDFSLPTTVETGKYRN
jgi:hypothetical protein